MKKFMSAFCVILLFGSFAYAETESPPNIVLIISDDQGFTDYGFMGHPEIETPHLDKLARQSAVFKRGYVPTALCRPALMTLVTGLYSHQNKTTGNDPGDTPQNRAHSEKAGKHARELLISHIDKTGSLPQWLASKGYVSHQSGKWWEGSYERGGFTEGMTRGFPERGGRHGDDGLKIGRNSLQPVTNFIDRSIEASKPFFIWYAPFMPHTPHTPPERLYQKYLNKGVQQRVAKYYAMCEWFDETCGDLVNHIDDAGVAENTLIIYVTDNGWVQTETGGYAARSKRSPNEMGTRTPIMFRWPGTIPAADRQELVSSIDLVPTMLTAAGAKGPHVFPGLNLLENLKSGEKIERDTIYGESFAHDIADIENPQASLLYRWVIKDNYKLLLTYDGRPGKMKYPPRDAAAQLYDLKSDPLENRNLATKHPQRVAKLSELLKRWYIPRQRQTNKLGATPSSLPERNAVTKPKPESRPNILLVYADDQRNHTLGCAGHEIVKTPNIDQLAANGVRFENAFVTTSTCWVGRSCLFTGCYERKHLYRVTSGPLNPTLCKSSFFAVLKQSGYRTGHIGKEHVAISEESAAKMWDVRRRLGRNPYFKKQEDGTERHETQILGDWGIDFLEQQPVDKPFCLQVSFNATHAEDGDKRPGIGHYPWPKVTDGMYEDQKMPLPHLNDPAIYESQPDFLKTSINRQRYFWRWDTPEKYQTNMRAYFRMLSGIDHVVGRLAQQLKKQGLNDNTIIIYTADNGYYLGDRGFAGKWTHYEQSLRVPLVIYDPRLPQTGQGKVISNIALNSDLASTIINLAGLPSPKSHTGLSLLPLINGERIDSWRNEFLCEFLAVPRTIPRWEGVRGTDWVYARYFVNGTDQPPFEFLHHIKNDPDQLVNLATSQKHKQALLKMRSRCNALITEAGPTMKEIEASQKSKK